MFLLLYEGRLQDDVSRCLLFLPILSVWWHLIRNAGSDDFIDLLTGKLIVAVCGMLAKRN